ncbi:hypothetical protein NM208_g5553 [Fusarium decemcellulare]|uniref:Uncharacterized protein n=1 Tax=Fusarium decemcellulare TaxID=57161 RepID=A0ACC1SGI9_9HYPO|nr:hypothetical protein NM208_g5553 [Fusarium decemcellulare]
MSNIPEQVKPVLRLRPTTATELIRPRQKIKQPDGPWIAHPDLIDDEWVRRSKKENLKPDATWNDYRDIWKAEAKDSLEVLKGCKPEDFLIKAVLEMGPLVDIQMMLNGMTDHEIALATEKQYVGAHLTLHAPYIAERFGPDWGMNARGIYYRHYYSPAWVTVDHSLWLPSLDDTDWNHHAEEGRRARARTFLKHVLDNEKWAKSEYAWEADAWTDVFGLMRDDPVLAIDKHEYNTIGQKRHPVTCLLTGESKFIRRIPDATFGLATFKPRDYQNYIAEWDLDYDRLEALKLHRHCGLISDPRWSDNCLVFPFAAYEAKGWSGDCREARRQACSAGAVYLDMLDRLARRPGAFGDKPGTYQTEQSRSSQVFVFTSFGSHWHVLVGYKRPRLNREHAGREGMSESVYLFQRIWSGRVTTERRAWELLSLIDQIHLWGATDFRDWVIRHLKPWHEFGKKCYVNDVDFIASAPQTSMSFTTEMYQFRGPGPCLALPKWTEHLQEEARLKLKDAAGYHLFHAFIKYRSKNQPKSDRFPDMKRCAIGQCRPIGGDPGYPLASIEEVKTHLREVHGEGEESVAEMVRVCEARDILLRLGFITNQGYQIPHLCSPEGKRRLEDDPYGEGRAGAESSSKRRKKRKYYRK